MAVSCENQSRLVLQCDVSLMIFSSKVPSLVVKSIRGSGYESASILYHIDTIWDGGDR